MFVKVLKLKLIKNLFVNYQHQKINKQNKN